MGQTEISHHPPGCASGIFLQTPQTQAHEDTSHKPNPGTFLHNHSLTFGSAEVTRPGRLQATRGGRGTELEAQNAVNAVSTSQQEPVATPAQCAFCCRPPKALTVKGTRTTASPPLIPEESSTCNFSLSMQLLPCCC